METKTTKFEVLEIATAALPTTFASGEEGASLAKMLELELEQASQVAGGLSRTVRCCSCHCCSCHC